jgi:hypothetical protein
MIALNVSVLAVLAVLAAVGFACLWVRTRILLKRAQQVLEKIRSPRQAMLVFGKWTDNDGSEHIRREDHSLKTGTVYYEILGGRLELPDGQHVVLDKPLQSYPAFLDGKIFGAAVRRIRFFSGFPMPVSGYDRIPDGTAIQLRFAS